MRFCRVQMHETGGTHKWIPPAGFIHSAVVAPGDGRWMIDLGPGVL
jgi:hypothetical protein